MFPDYCTPNPCQNNGTFVSGDGSYLCQCTPFEYDGPRCENSKLKEKTENGIVNSIATNNGLLEGEAG